MGNDFLISGSYLLSPTGGPVRNSLSQSVLGRIMDGLPDGVDRPFYPFPASPDAPQHEWEPSRVTQTPAQDLSHRIKSLGNAVVPPLVEVIAKAILEFEKERRNPS
jgi:site-specific DNA-cytosine methylase